MEKIVWKVKVMSRNFMTDMFSNWKNIIGGRLKAYEKMIDTTLESVSEDFYKEFPNAKDIRIEFTEFTGGAVAVTIHGVINVE